MSPTRVLVAALALTLCAFFPAGGLAGTQDNARIVFHVQAHTYKSSTMCTTVAPTVPCSQYVKEWPVEREADVYVVVARASMAPGVAGLSLGISYDPAWGSGVDVFESHLCGDFEYPTSGPCGQWPAAYSGNRITWDPVNNCQRTVIDPDGVHAIACVMYVFAYGPDVLSLTPPPIPDPELEVVDCSGAVTTYEQYPGQAPERVGFGIPVPAVPTTWGRVKRSFAE